MYGGFSYSMGFGGGFVMFLIAAVLLVVPFWRILPRHGIPNWVAIVAIIPIGALILLWVVAFKDGVDGSAGKS